MSVRRILQSILEKMKLANQEYSLLSSLLTRPDFKGNSGLLNRVAFLVRITGKHQCANYASLIC